MVFRAEMSSTAKYTPPVISLIRPTRPKAAIQFSPFDFQPPLHLFVVPSPNLVDDDVDVGAVDEHR